MPGLILLLIYLLNSTILTALQPAEKVPQPKIYKGLYIRADIFRSSNKFNKIYNKAKSYGINALVIDVQPPIKNTKALMKVSNDRIYKIARVVCFDQGMRREKPTAKKMERLLKTAEKAAKLGFEEIQLDYIRYADNWGKYLTPKKKYENIASVIREFHDYLKPYNVKISADIFGRIPFTEDDIIGQRIEVFGNEVDVLYPMLYPSHFYGDNYLKYNPYQTIYEGTDRTVKRLEAMNNPRTQATVAWIQGFYIDVDPSGMSFTRYIYDQMIAAERAGQGWIVWNARNNYKWTWRALELVKKKNDSLIENKPLKWRGYNY